MTLLKSIRFYIKFINVLIFALLLNLVSFAYRKDGSCMDIVDSFAIEDIAYTYLDSYLGFVFEHLDCLDFASYDKMDVMDVMDVACVVYSYFGYDLVASLDSMDASFEGVRPSYMDSMNFDNTLEDIAAVEIVATVVEAVAFLYISSLVFVQNHLSFGLVACCIPSLMDCNKAKDSSFDNVEPCMDYFSYSDHFPFLC